METLGLTEFKAKLCEVLEDSPEAQELTEDDLKQLHADYYKSGLTFNEWLKQYVWQMKIEYVDSTATKKHT